MGSLFFSGRHQRHLLWLYAEFWRLVPRANVVLQRDSRKNRYATSAITESVTKKEGNKLKEKLLYSFLRFGRHYVTMPVCPRIRRLILEIKIAKFSSKNRQFFNVIFISKYNVG